MKKRCVCGREFWASHPKHTRCRLCFRTIRKTDQEQQAAAFRQRECTADQAVLREALRQALLAKTLPRSAKVLGDRGQVTVSWMGRSETFHLPPSAFA